MLDSILARFEDNPSMVNENQAATFNACLTDLAAHADFPRLMAEQAADDFWFREDDWRSSYRPYKVSGGILTIPVKGVLLHDFAWQFGSYATGYDYILKAFERGMSDAAVRGIAFLIHSPGGDVAGCFDAVDKMFAAKKGKPVRAFAHEYAYSAAYAIASLADKIVVSRTGGVGSIGVVTSHVDYSKAMEQAGVKVTFIKFGAHKVDGNPYEPLGADAQARIQARIDALGEVFVSTVARNRKLDAKKVRDTEALTFTASEAVANGLADSVGPLDDAVAAFAADLENPQQGDEEMTDKTSAVDQAALENARAEGHAAGMKEGAAAEQKRISAIMGSAEGKARPAAAQMLIGLGVDSATAIEQMKTLPEEKPAASAEPPKTDAGAQFNAIVGAGAPKISAGTNEEGKPSRTAAISAAMGWGKK